MPSLTIWVHYITSGTCHVELNTVEPHPVDTALLWTPHHCGHFSPGPFSFPYYSCLLSFTSVDSGHLAYVDSDFLSQSIKYLLHAFISRLSQFIV